MERLAPLRVLVVDDYHDGAQATGMLLQHLGCEVCVTYSGEEAVRVAPGFAPELVILDLNMPPGLDGYETAIELKKQKWSSKAAFVAHTASADPCVAEKVWQAGFSHFVRKPAHASAFDAIVTELLADTQSTRVSVTEVSSSFPIR
jgi:CheY-like chemotaxis protein